MWSFHVAQDIHTAERLWPHAADTISESGLSDQISRHIKEAFGTFTPALGAVHLSSITQDASQYQVLTGPM